MQSPKILKAPEWLTQEELVIVNAVNPGFLDWWEQALLNSKSLVYVSFFCSMAELAIQYLENYNSWPFGLNIEVMLPDLIPADLDFVKIIATALYLREVSTAHDLSRAEEEIEQIRQSIQQLLTIEV